MPQPVQRPLRRSASAVDGEPRCREDQQEREVGGRLVEHARRVAHRDAARGRGRDIDVVVADRDVGDHAQAGSARGENFVVDDVGELTDERVDVRDLSDELVVGERRVVGALRRSRGRRRRAGRGHPWATRG